MNKNKSKVWVWLRNRSFPALLLLVGIIYFTVTDNWQVYGEPLTQAGAWCNAGLEKLGINVESVFVKEEKKIRVRTADILRTDDVAQVDVFGEGYWVSPTEAPICQEPQELVYANVEDDYFSDAVFIGDSRTVGMYEYGGLEDISTFYAATGLTVHKLFDKKIVEVQGQKEKLTVEEALQTRSFEKIYLMVGINEMGTGTVETFMAKYKEAVAHLQELQPDAIIYLQAIMKVTTERSEQGDYINNEGIDQRNAEIAKLADNVRIYYLDVNEAVCDETGAMEASYTYDGVHLKAQYISLWKEYLKAHAVSVE